MIANDTIYGNIVVDRYKQEGTMMDNIKRCEWCFEEYEVSDIVVKHVNNEIAQFCSEDCWDEHLLDVVEDDEGEYIAPLDTITAIEVESLPVSATTGQLVVYSGELYVWITSWKKLT